MSAPLIIHDAGDNADQQEVVIMLADFSFTAPEQRVVYPGDPVARRRARHQPEEVSRGKEGRPRLDGRQVRGRKGQFPGDKKSLITLRLKPKRFLKQDEHLHEATIVWALRGKAMRHLEELGIGGFDPVDGAMREALAADLIDPF